MVYPSTSEICFVLLLNTGLVTMCIHWQKVKKLFLGSLSEAEAEKLKEQSGREIVDTLFAVILFRQHFSVTFLAMITSLLLIKALHWMAQNKVEYIETMATEQTFSHVRIVSLVVFLFMVDCFLFTSSFKSLIQAHQVSVAIFFAFEYMIMAATAMFTFVTYIFHVSSTIMEGQWQKKAVYTFYVGLVGDFFHLLLYTFFSIAVFPNYGVPVYLIRKLHEIFRNSKIRVAYYFQYRKITSSMNEHFPDATPQELDLGDATCIICREEMTSAKKLLCCHLFHVQCLRSWLERQHTCPTCRALIEPAHCESPARQQGIPA